jgi:hypothetical protein
MTAAARTQVRNFRYFNAIYVGSMRPKASELHLNIAAAFAKAVTLTLNDDSKLNSPNVKCKGPTSIFSALKVCIPEIVRLPNSDCILHNTAVSEIELNKFLSRSGFVSSRCRNRVKGTTDKWTKGFQRWKSIRWLDPRSPEELSQLQTKLAEISDLSNAAYSIHESQLIHFISNLHFIEGDCPQPRHAAGLSPALVRG